MKRLFLFVVLAIALVGCGSVATQSTPIPDADSALQTVDKSGNQPGLSFTYPTGWELLEADMRGLMVYSVPDAGLRLYSPGLTAGEVVIQVSATPRARVESDLASYAISLVEMTDSTHQDPQPVTINGFEGYQAVGERDEFTILVTVTEQYGEIVEVVAYTTPDEAETHRPMIDALIESAIWKLPTE